MANLDPPLDATMARAGGWRHVKIVAGLVGLALIGTVAYLAFRTSRIADERDRLATRLDRLDGDVRRMCDRMAGTYVFESARMDPAYIARARITGITDPDDASDLLRHTAPAVWLCIDDSSEAHEAPRWYDTVREAKQEVDRLIPLIDPGRTPPGRLDR